MKDAEGGEDNLNFIEQDGDATDTVQSIANTNSFRKSTPVHMRNMISDCNTCKDVIVNGRPAGVRSCKECNIKWAKGKKSKN